MLTSIERVQNSTTIRSNLNSYWNKDFRLLIQYKLKAKKEQEFVMGMTPAEFVNVFRIKVGTSEDLQLLVHISTGPCLETTYRAL